jgi:hypothetical protein
LSDDLPVSAPFVDFEDLAGMAVVVTSSEEPNALQLDPPDRLKYVFIGVHLQ